ncbi:hypothetical protein A6F68_01053 [Tsuneonella dongtanensis]|uniref:SF3 helicase domain-containing protein n=2 Tax=Tsuneonella dongtanensis TaxID=692370 RepID=A0A1B2ABU9_9SPHN|nr:hypothetical protein A6F68_01053 [Tsuneonella dongtanensis]
MQDLPPALQEAIAQVVEDKPWSFDRAKAWLDEKIAVDPHGGDYFADAVHELLRLLSRDPNLSDTHRDAIFSYIRRHDGVLDFKKRDLIDGLNRLRADLKKQEPTDHAIIARQVLRELEVGGEIRFHLGQFWQWNGSRFARLDEHAIYMHVATNVKSSMLVRRNSDYKAIVEVLEKMCKGPLRTFDTLGLNFANGFVGADLVIADHDPKFGATFTLPFEYDPENAKCCNRFLEFLHSCWGAEADFGQRVLALQEAFAATLYGIAPDYQRAFLLFGRAGTGKTVLLKILRALLPPDALAELGPQYWGVPFHLIDLIGKSVNICGELPENGLITGNIFKEVVEGSPVRDSFKGKDGIVFKPIAAHWFASNYLPRSRDTSRGFIRRWLILDFNHPVTKEHIIENLAEIIVSEERHAIAAWALDGLRRLLDQRGYTLPRCHSYRGDQMRRINNAVHSFLEDDRNYTRGDGTVGCRELFESYNHHSREMGRLRSLSFEQFMQKLEDLDLIVQRDDLGDFLVYGLLNVEGKKGNPRS